MPKHIELFKAANCWMADFIGDDEVRELFGTTQLPTPYTPHVDAAVVLADVQRRNPA